MLVIGSALIFSGREAGGALPYAAGVSIYSTVLVFYPARVGVVGLAALVYAVAGWVGSALGIGVAEQFGWFPVWWLLLPGAVFGLVAFRRRSVQ